jgi:hypothetical protein
MIASAQISVYPLRQDRLGPAIEGVRKSLADHRLTPEVRMSTIVAGEGAAIFAALREAFAKAAELGEVVMTVTVSNAAEGAQLRVEHIAGAVYYPRCGLIARLIAPADRPPGELTTFGAAFIAVRAGKA